MLVNGFSGSDGQLQASEDVVLRAGCAEMLVAWA